MNKEEKRKLNNKKNYTRSKTRKAILNGTLTKQPCHCGETKVDAHHLDYNDHLNVKWLCRKHHFETHFPNKKRKDTPNPDAVSLGKLGGLARAKKLSKEKLSEISQKGVEARLKAIKY